MKRVPVKRQRQRHHNGSRSRSPSPLTDLPLEVQLETEDENGKMIPMLQIRTDILQESENSCELCGRCFPNSAGLRTHERSHNGPVQNQPKGSASRIASELKQLNNSSHISPLLPLPLPLLNTHLIKGPEDDADAPGDEDDQLLFYPSEKTHQCGQCSITCSSASTLRLHIQRKHQPPPTTELQSDPYSPVSLTSLPSGPVRASQTDFNSRYWKDGLFYVCTYCGKSFLHIVGFRSHWRRHEREEHEVDPNSLSTKY